MLNVLIGLLLPASRTGLANASSGGGSIAAAWVAGLTLGREVPGRSARRLDELLGI
jgi:hypothetical protein